MTIELEDIKIVLDQCTNQNALSPIQVAGFALAYADAKSRHQLSFKPKDIKSFTHRWALMIEPRNKKYRRTPVAFANGSTALPPDQVERQMDIFFQEFANGVLNARGLYQMFEQIHPYEDGNGRLGHLLWALKLRSESGSWPMCLPPLIEDWTRSALV